MSSCSVTAPELIVKQPSEVRRYSMDFSNLLSTGELITSISSVTSELRGGGVSNLTVYNEVKSSDSLSVQFWVSGGTNNSTYRIEITVVTSGGETIEGDGLISVRDN